MRVLLREQCLSPTPEYTEDIRENLKIFDRLFAEFEYSYVQCMVHVKSAREYELHQDLIVLFSDTLQRALKNEMVTQDVGFKLMLLNTSFGLTVHNHIRRWWISMSLRSCSPCRGSPSSMDFSSVLGDPSTWTRAAQG